MRPFWRSFPPVIGCLRSVKKSRFCCWTATQTRLEQLPKIGNDWPRCHGSRVGVAAMGMFDGKKGLILGVANDRSIAWAIAQVIMKEGGVCGFNHLPDKPDDERQRN